MFLPTDLRLDGPRTLSCMCHAVGVYREDWFGFSCLWTMVSKSQFVGQIHICLALLKNQSTSSGSSSPMVNVRSPVLFSLRARFSGLEIAYPVMSQEQAVIIKTRPGKILKMLAQ